jgi:hypothetical protein
MIISILYRQSKMKYLWLLQAISLAGIVLAGEKEFRSLYEGKYFIVEGRDRLTDEILF